MANEKDNYSDCITAFAGLCVAIRRGMKRFLEKERVVNTLQASKYINHSRLERGLSPGAKPMLTVYAFFEITRYCYEHQDCIEELKENSWEEWIKFVNDEGPRIHAIAKKRDTEES